MKFTLELRGPVPAKKNRLRVSRRRGHYADGVKAALDSLRLQAQSAWRGREPLESVFCIDVVFLVRDGRADADGKYTTVQDVLVKAGVLRNDSIARVPAFSVHTVRTVGDEMSLVSLEA